MAGAMGWGVISLESYWYFLFLVFGCDSLRERGLKEEGGGYSGCSL